MITIPLDSVSYEVPNLTSAKDEEKYAYENLKRLYSEAVVHSMGISPPSRYKRNFLFKFLGK